MGRRWKIFEANWKFFFIILIPIIFLFIPFLPIVPVKRGDVTSYESLCLYVIIIMSSYWIFNALPLVITALIPLGLIPLFGITYAKTFAGNYMREPTMVVFGSLMLGCSYLLSNLHKRMALKMMTITGNLTTRIITALFLVTLFLSMFITSVAAAFIMVGVANVFMDEREDISEADEEEIDTEMLAQLHSNIALRERDEAHFYPGVHRTELITPSNLIPLSTEGSQEQITKQPQKQDPQKLAVDNMKNMKNKKPLQQTTDNIINKPTKLYKKSSPIKIQPSEQQLNAPAETEAEEDGKKEDTTVEEQKQEHEHHDVDDDGGDENERNVDEAETEGLEQIDQEVKLDLSSRESIEKKLRKQLYIIVYIAGNIGAVFLPFASPMSDILYDWTDDRPNELTMGKNQTRADLSLSFRSNGKKTFLCLGKWILYMIPIIIILSTIAWFYLELIFTRFCPAKRDGSRIFSKLNNRERKVLKLERNIYIEKYRKLGKISFHQVAVITFTIILFFLWIFKDPRSSLFNGWSRQIPYNNGNTNTVVKAGHSAPIILIVTIMFMIPRVGSSKATQAVLGWKFLEAQVLWNVLLLLGGCYALSQAIHESGLSIILLGHYNKWAATGGSNCAIHATSILLTWVLTEIISGVASVNFIIQVFTLLSRWHWAIGYASMPATVMSNLGFMFPVATPVNVVVFTAAGGELNILDMIKYGAFMDITALITVLCVHFAYGNAFYDIT